MDEFRHSNQYRTSGNMYSGMMYRFGFGIALALYLIGVPALLIPSDYGKAIGIFMIVKNIPFLADLSLQ